MSRQTWRNFTYEDRKKIRQSYEPIMADLKAGKRRDVYAIWPHDWYQYMSPIEWNVWQDIRSYGLPLYPQVPCGKYFIDFADPHLGIAIEVDGKEWHTDTTKDQNRENYIRNHGYDTIIRFGGNITFTSLDHEALADENDIYDYDEESSEYTIMRLRDIYFSNHEDTRVGDENA